MANVSVYNMEGKEVEKIDLSDAVFGVEGGIEDVGEEVGILEVEQQPDADGDGDAAKHFFQDRLFGFVHPPHQVEVGDDRHDEVNDELGRAVGVED